MKSQTANCGCVEASANKAENGGAVLSEHTGASPPAFRVGIEHRDEQAPAADRRDQRDEHAPGLQSPEIPSEPVVGVLGSDQRESRSVASCFTQHSYRRGVASVGILRVRAFILFCGQRVAGEALQPGAPSVSRGVTWGLGLSQYARCRWPTPHLP